MMDFDLSIAAHVFTGLGILGLGWLTLRLRREIRGLRQRCQLLAGQIDELTQEVGGLCAAGAQRDRATIEQDQRLRECLERVESLQVDEAGSSPYHGAIEMIRKGASAQDVASDFGISLAEAELLARLHRNGA